MSASELAAAQAYLSGTRKQPSVTDYRPSQNGTSQTTNPSQQTERPAIQKRATNSIAANPMLFQVVNVMLNQMV